jgi:hypothetical protein
MGNITSSPTSVASVPLQRTPTYDGTSGLQYSGRVYTNQFAQLSTDICKDASSVTVDQINDVMPNSISTTTLPVDDSTGRISQSAIQGYVENLVGTGAIPGQMATFDQQMQADKTFYGAIQAEYCFYETRYQAALAQFLSLAAQPQGADPNAVQAALDATTALNKRLNSLLEVLNYVGNERARRVNNRGPKIDAANAALDQKLAILRQQQETLTSGVGRVQTQEEMVRYSAEKSRAMNIQIMFFVALNVVALGTVLTVYKSLRPGGGAV